MSKKKSKKTRPAGKFTRRADGSWVSANRRWRIVRSAMNRYDLHDQHRAEGDTLHAMGMPTVVACEESARAKEWAENKEEDPAGKAPEE